MNSHSTNWSGPPAETCDSGVSARRTVLVVGLGSHHGDDRMGWMVCDQLSRRAFSNVAFRFASSPVDILDWIEAAETLVVCDACRGAGTLGSVHRWMWPSNELQAVDWSGTHDLSLPATLSLAERLGRLPAKVVIWGIEADDGTSRDDEARWLSDAVSKAVQRVADDLAGSATNS